MTRFLLALLALLGLAAQAPVCARASEMRHPVGLVSVERISAQPGIAQVAALKAAAPARASALVPAVQTHHFVAAWAVVSPVLYGIDRAHE